MQRLRLPNRLPRISTQPLSRWLTRLALLILIMLAGGLMVGFVRMTWTRHQINQQIEKQAAENEALKARNAALKGEAEFRESDVYAEQAAREQLGMARDGETVLLPTVVVPATPEPTPPPAVAAAEPEVVEAEATHNYQRWWRALFPPSPATP